MGPMYIQEFLFQQMFLGHLAQIQYLNEDESINFVYDHHRHHHS